VGTERAAQPVEQRPRERLPGPRRERPRLEGPDGRGVVGVNRVPEEIVPGETRADVAVAAQVVEHQVLLARGPVVGGAGGAL
jgi:hypothetical protein